MPKLSIHLQDGFDDDEVVVSVDGSIMRRLEHVTTRLLLGYADEFQVEMQQTECSLRIVLPRRNLEAEAVVRLPAYVGASVAEGGLMLLSSDRPFGYA